MMCDPPGAQTENPAVRAAIVGAATGPLGCGTGIANNRPCLLLHSSLWTTIQMLLESGWLAQLGSVWVYSVRETMRLYIQA